MPWTDIIIKYSDWQHDDKSLLYNAKPLYYTAISLIYNVMFWYYNKKKIAIETCSVILLPYPENVMPCRHINAYMLPLICHMLTSN